MPCLHPARCRQRWAVLSPLTLAVVDSREHSGRPFGRTCRAVPAGPGKEQFAGAPHRGSPPTGDVSDGMVSDARVVARAATMDCTSTSESQPPQRRVVVRDPLLPPPFGGWFPSADAGH